MKRRLQIVRPRRRIQGKTPKRSKYFKSQLNKEQDKNKDGPSADHSNVTRDQVQESNPKTLCSSVSPSSPTPDFSCEVASTPTIIENNVDNPEVMKKSVADIMGRVEKDQLDIFVQRSISALHKECEKKNPDDKSIAYYLDILFNKRRSDIASTPLNSRLQFITKIYPVIIGSVEQVSCAYSIYTYFFRT